MLVSQKAHREVASGNGIPAIGLAELRSQMANGASLDDAHRQRLQKLAQRLARVQALGDEYVGITFSPMAAAELERATATRDRRPVTRAEKSCLSKRPLCTSATSTSGVPSLVAGR